MADLFTLSIKGVCVVFVWFQLCRPEQYSTLKVNSYSFCTFSHFPETVSKCTTVLIVFERVIAVTWPFRFKQICTPLRTTVAIVVIFVVILATSMPTFIDIFIFFHKTEQKKDEYPTIVKEGHQYLTKRLFKSDIQFLSAKAYRAINFIPIPFTLIGNIVIIRGLRKSNPVRSSSTESQQQGKKRERQITKLCLTISFIFLILSSPYDVYVFLFFTNVIEYTRITQTVGVTFITLGTMNSGVNFIIYATMNKKYRQDYLALITCFRRIADGGSSVESTWK